jgi:hypothetical protein
MERSELEFRRERAEAVSPGLNARTPVGGTIPPANVTGLRPVVPVISLEERRVAALEANTRAMSELAAEMRHFREEREDRLRRQFRQEAAQL